MNDKSSKNLISGWPLWVLFLSALPLLFKVGNIKLVVPEYGDTKVYWEAAVSIFSGKTLYQDTLYEYPPYSILLFLGPYLFGAEAFQTAFAFQMTLIDSAIKCMIISLFYKIHATRVRLFIALCLFVGCGLFQIHFYLERFDLAVAGITVAILLLCQKENYLCVGFLLAIGIGIKLYPLILALPLFILSKRKMKWKSFSVGALIGFLPLIILLPWFPWFNFFGFHLGRGLQVESFYASAVALLRFIVPFDAQTVTIMREGGRSWVEITGGAAVNYLLAVSKILFPFATILSIAASSLTMWKEPSLSIGKVSRLLLLPLTSFVIFNPVLSPQYTIWLVPIACVALTDGPIIASFIIGTCSWITPLFFPSEHYGSGFTLFSALALFSRNLLLLFAWFLLLNEEMSTNIANLLKRTSRNLFLKRALPPSDPKNY